MSVVIESFMLFTLSISLIMFLKNIKDFVKTFSKESFYDLLFTTFVMFLSCVVILICEMGVGQ